MSIGITTGLAIASLATTVIGTGFGIASSLKEGEAAQDRSTEQAAISRRNAVMSHQLADLGRQRGDQKRFLVAQQTRQLIGQQRAILAGHGVVVDQGSALDITTDTAEQGALEGLVVRDDEYRNALLRDLEGEDFAGAAQQLQLAGDQARTSGQLGAFAQGFGGLATVADKWQAFSKEGVFG